MKNFWSWFGFILMFLGWFIFIFFSIKSLFTLASIIIQDVQQIFKSIGWFFASMTFMYVGGTIFEKTNGDHSGR